MSNENLIVNFLYSSLVVNFVLFVANIFGSGLSGLGIKN
jgi:hypothetical protein